MATTRNAPELGEGRDRTRADRTTPSVPSGCAPPRHPPRRQARCRLARSRPRAASSSIGQPPIPMRQGSSRPMPRPRFPAVGGAHHRGKGRADRTGADRGGAGSAHDADRRSGTVLRLVACSCWCRRPCVCVLDRRIREPDHLGRRALCETGAAAVRGRAAGARRDVVARTGAVDGDPRRGGGVRRAPTGSPSGFRSTGGASSRVVSRPAV